MNKLPSPQREAIERLVLSEDERSLSEISRELGIPISTLKSRVILGIEKVRKKLRKKRLL
jgi:DNA-directed RNA polymerase specialized sigma24 family protein